MHAIILASCERFFAYLAANAALAFEENQVAPDGDFVFEPWAVDGFRLFDWALNPSWPAVEFTHAKSARVEQLLATPLTSFGKTRTAILRLHESAQSAPDANVSEKGASMPSLTMSRFYRDEFHRDAIIVRFLRDSEILRTGHQRTLRRLLMRGRTIANDLASPRGTTLAQLPLLEPVVVDIDGERRSETPALSAYSLWHEFREFGRMVSSDPQRMKRGRKHDPLPYFFLRGLHDHFVANGLKLASKDAELIAQFWAFDVHSKDALDPDRSFQRWDGRLATFKGVARSAQG